MKNVIYTQMPDFAIEVEYIEDRGVYRLNDKTRYPYDENASLEIPAHKLAEVIQAVQFCFDHSCTMAPEKYGVKK